MDKTQPTVPSPPQAKILRFKTFLNISNLKQIIIIMIMMIIKDDFFLSTNLKKISEWVRVGDVSLRQTFFFFLIKFINRFEMVLNLTIINNNNNEMNFFYPILGPPWVKSKTCLGFNIHWNFCMSLTPWFPPDFGLIKTITGLTEADGIGFITNVRHSFSIFSFDLFFIVCFFLGDFLRLDLKLPLRGNLTIHDGGTIICWWLPEFQSIIYRYYYYY